MRFPLKDVTVRNVIVTRRVAEPLFANGYWQINQREFAMQAEGVADFYACDGREVEYAPVHGADRNSIELYLNGSVYGAILHQRQIMPLHGSCFRYNDMAVMVCGDAGAGKSSLTASFCLNGAEFLTDDITPVIFRDGLPHIWAMSDRIKLWDDSLEQFGLQKAGLSGVHPEVDKYYLPMHGGDGGNYRLDRIIILQNTKEQEVIFKELTGPEKFAAVRSEIYRPEYLAGMSGNVPVYFSQTIEMCSLVRVFRVKRPVNIRVLEMHKAILDRFWGLADES